MTVQAQDLNGIQAAAPQPVRAPGFNARGRLFFKYVALFFAVVLLAVGANLVLLAVA